MAQLDAMVGRRGFLGLAAAATAAVGIGAAACSPDTSSGGSSEAKTGLLRIATSDGSTNDTFDPLRMERAMQILTACMVYESLVDVDESLQPVPRLAESFETPDDGVTWDFTLRSEVTFHDGSPLTTDDVISSISRALDPNEGSGNSLAGQLAGILRPGGITAVDDHTVRFKLDKKYVFFPSAMATRFARVYQAGTADFARPNGTGPFAFESFKPGRSFIAVRYDDYWGDAASLDRIEVTNYGNESTRLSAFIDGDVDVMFEIATAAAPDILATDGLTILEQQNAKWIPLALDTTVAPFDDPEVIKAIKLAVDREQVIEVGLGGYGTLGYDTPIPAEDFYFAGLDAPAHDPDAARDVLAAAGYADGLKLPALTCLDLAAANSMALVLQQQLAEVGIEFEVERESAATYWDASWLQKPFYSNDYLRRTPDEILKLSFVSGGPWNMSKREDPELDAAVEAASQTTDVAVQKEQYGIAQQLIAERDSTIISAHLPRLSGLSESVSGVTTNPVYFLDLRKAGVAA